MSKQQSLWFGYLEASDKSSAVVMDDGLNTGNPATVYIFNLARRAIIEYKREIVEPKLRELKPKETKLVDELMAAYKEAQRDFKPREARRPMVTESAAKPKAKGKTPVPAPEAEAVEIDIDDDVATDDWDDDDD